MTMNRRSLLGGMAMVAGSAVMAAGAAPLQAVMPRRRFFDRIGKPLGLQIYTLGDDPARDLDGTFARLAAIGYRDIELPGLLGRTPAQIRAAADRAGLAISCIHLNASSRGAPGGLLVTSDAQAIADALGALGAHQAVMPMMLLPDRLDRQPGESFQAMLARLVAQGGVDLWKRTAALLNDRAAALKPFGITLGYHNHNIEFAPVGNTTGWDIIAAETDPTLVPFELDLGWVATAGLDPVAFLNRYSGRVRWVHVKDIKPATVANFALESVPAEVGAGKLDWARILPAAHKAGVQHYYVEQEPPFAIPRIDAVARSYAYLAALRA